MKGFVEKTLSIAGQERGETKNTLSSLGIPRRESEAQDLGGLRKLL